MTSLAGYAQLQRLYLKVFHEGLHALGDSAKVVVSICWFLAES